MQRIQPCVGQRSVSQDGSGAGAERGGTEQVDAQQAAQVELLRLCVRIDFDRPLRVQQVAELSAEARLAGGAVERAAVGEASDRSAGAELQGQGNAAGILADGGEAARQEGRRELVHACRREFEVFDLQIEHELLHLGQADDGAVHGARDAGMFLGEGQARDMEVVDVALDLAAPDLEHGGIVLEFGNEPGCGLYGQLRGLHVGFNPHLREEIRQRIEAVVVQRDAPHVEVRPGVTEMQVFDQGPVHAYFRAGGEPVQGIAGLLRDEAAVDGGEDLAAVHAYAVAGQQAHQDVEVVEVEAVAGVAAVVGQEAVHPETEILDPELLDIEDVARGEFAVPAGQVEDAGDVVAVFAGLGDEVEEGVLDRDAAYVQALSAQEPRDVEGGRDLLGAEDGVHRGPAPSVDVFGVGGGVHELHVADHQHARGHHLQLVVLDAAVHDGGQLVEGDLGQARLDIGGLDGHECRHQQYDQQTEDTSDYVCTFPVHAHYLQSTKIRK